MFIVFYALLFNSYTAPERGTLILSIIVFIIRDKSRWNVKR